MKIAYLTHSFAPYVGGVQYVVEHMAREMAKRGHTVEVLTLAPPSKSLSRVEEADGFVVKRFLGLSPSHAYYVPTPALIKALAKLEADVVHVHVVHSLVPLAAYLVKLLKPRWGRLVLTPHFHDVGFSWHTNVAWHFYHPILKRIVQAADVVHSISPHEAQLLKARLGVDPVVITHGVSDDVLTHTWNPPQEVTITYAGRLMGYKRVSLLIRAVSQLRQFLPDARLVIIGEGPEKATLIELARKLQVDASFIPYLPRQEYLDSIADSTTFVNLSRSEAFCITVLEALSIGVPSIVVKPWGQTFNRDPRAVILSHNCTPKDVCNAIHAVHPHNYNKPTNPVPWGEVCEVILDKLYLTPINKRA